jgi:hypothetical protein
MILKTVTMLACLAHLLAPADSAVLWLIVSLAGFLILLPLSRIPLRAVLRRNLLISIFAVTISLFQLLTSMAAGETPDYRFVTVTAVRIILSYNFVALSLSWIGTAGFLHLLALIRSERIRLFLLLFARTVQSLMKLSRMIVFQIQSRIGAGARKRLLIPRWYLQNLIAGELYSLHRFQTGLASRLQEEIPEPLHQPAGRADYAAATLLTAIMAAGITIRFMGG